MNSARLLQLSGREIQHGELGLGPTRKRQVVLGHGREAIDLLGDLRQQMPSLGAGLVEVRPRATPR